MKRMIPWLGLLLGLVALNADAQTRTTTVTTNHLGILTNPPAVWESWAITSVMTTPVPTNIPPRFVTNTAFLRRFTQTYTYTNRTFHSFLPGTLHHLIWTNYLSLTNRRDLRIWSERQHSAKWPATPPEVKWNTNCIIWGMKGVTALSPCWQGEGAAGQVPLTLLTRRHAYARGHGMGDPGINETKKNLKAWFVTANNSVIEVKIKRAIIRSGMETNKVHRDYTILLFDRDLPESIESMSVASLADMEKYYGSTVQ
jgi:hypothetical protein